LNYSILRVLPGRVERLFALVGLRLVYYVKYQFLSIIVCNVPSHPSVPRVLALSTGRPKDSCLFNLGSGGEETQAHPGFLTGRDHVKAREKAIQIPDILIMIM